MTIPAAAGGLGETAVTMSVQVPGPAVLSLTAARPDVLTADNVAALVMPPPPAPRIGLVHGGPDPDRFLVGLLNALEPRRLTVLPAPTGVGGSRTLSGDPCML